MSKFSCAKCGNPLEFVDALQIERDALQAELLKTKAQLAAKAEESAWKQAREGAPETGAENTVDMEWRLAQAQAALGKARQALEASRSWDWTSAEVDKALAEIDAVLEG